MVASYYYYASTLPLLRFDGTPPFSTATFMATAKGQVSGRDYHLLETALANRTSSHPFIRAWQHHRACLEGELASQRSKRKGYKSELYPHSGDTEQLITETVRQALLLDDPLKAELLLLELSWKQLDEQVGLDVFNIEALLGFALKLQLLERKSRFDRVSGNSEFERMFTNLQIEIAKL